MPPPRHRDDRRTFCRASASLAAGSLGTVLGVLRWRPRIQRSSVRTLVARGRLHTQSRLGNWTANNGQYPTAMTALAGMALLGEGSTTMQGKYSANLRKAVDYLVTRSRSNGPIGDPDARRSLYVRPWLLDDVPSQVLAEEEDAVRRKELIDILTRR